MNTTINGALGASYTNTAEGFRQDIERIARETGKHPLAVFAAWQRYARACESGDQSPVLGEFEEQYKANPQEPELQKWETGEGLGPRMVKAFNDAVKAASWAARGTTELTGIIEKPETHKTGMVFVQMFGGPVHGGWIPTQLDIQSRLGHVITAKNYKEFVEAFQAAERWFSANPIIVDKRVSQAEHDEEERKREEFIKRNEEENKRAAQAQSDQVAQARAKYPWAKQDGSEHARGAANLKTLLAMTFPGVDFTVRSESYSGGSSIRVGWELGPTEKEVKAITGLFEQRSFDGMTDSESQNEHNAGYYRWLGGAGYVFENRSLTPTTIETVASALVAHGYARGEAYRQDQDTADRVALDILTGTSLPAGAVVTGVERRADGDEGEGHGFGRYYRLTFTKPEVSAVAAAPVTSASGVTVTRNEAKGGVEIRFPAKPAQATIDRVKAAGFRWSRFSGCWWAKASERTLAFAYGLAGKPVEGENATPARDAKPEPVMVRDPGEDAADRWAEIHQNGLACNA